MERKITLYHGSDKIIEKPEFGKEVKHTMISVWVFIVPRVKI